MKKEKPTIKVLENGNLHIHIPMLTRRMQGRKLIFAPETIDGENESMPETVQLPIVQALARAFSWGEMIENGTYKSIKELSKDLEVDASYVARIIKLTTLAPNIIKAILNGKEPSGLSLRKLAKSFPLEWEEQREFWEF